MSEDETDIPAPTETEQPAPLTFSVAEGPERLGVTEAWYLRHLRARKLPGHRIGRQWRLAESDLQGALELTAVPAIVAPVDIATPTTRRRYERRLRR
ncbi:excisionase family DNA-binding protein [Rhodococcus sp. Q]|uniref:excisionase family DNA-binding protein n=1 Tax=Rhodococcus sp. Q TaxID=2502252 RepID=UPI0010F71B22|nr:excisionase family DNA-binding protein [Rhodococcus sp. Q]